MTYANYTNQTRDIRSGITYSYAKAAKPQGIRVIYMPNNSEKWCYIELKGCGKKRVILVSRFTKNGKPKIKYQCMNCGKIFYKHPDIKIKKKVIPCKKL